MTRLFIMALLTVALAATFTACHPVQKPPPLPVPIAPHVLPEFRCGRWRERFCELAPNWRVAEVTP